MGKKTTLAELGKLLKSDDKKGDTSFWGVVQSVNTDSSGKVTSYNVNLGGDTGTIKCRKLAGAEVNNTVLVTLRSTGEAVVVGTKNGDSDIAKSLGSVVTYYALGDSETTAPTTGWSTTAPAHESGKYMWMKTVTTKNDGTTTTTVTCIQGADGEGGQSSFKSIVFKRSTSTPATPSGGSYSSPVPSGWNDGVPDGTEQLWMSTRIFTSDGESPQESAWTTPGKVGATGASGADGYNTATVALYKRSASAPSVDWTNALTYNFSTHSLSSIPSGWYNSIPDGTNPLYVTNATAFSNTGTDTITYTEWSSPVKLAENGKDGEDGEDGQDGDSITISSKSITYQKSTSGTVTPTGTWLPDPPTLSAGEYLWTKTVITFSDTTSVTSYSVGYHGTNGQDGTDGEDGDTPTIGSDKYWYIGGVSTGIKAEGTDGDDGTPIVWKGSSASAPSNPQVDWCYRNTTDGKVYIYNGSSWVLMTQDGEDGQDGTDGTDGTDGLNVATVFLYQRATSQPSQPSGAVTYTFATGAVTGLTNNWVKNIPSNNGNPCWVIQATASNTGATDSIAASEWSTAVKLVEDGTEGDSADIDFRFSAVTTSPGNPTDNPSNWHVTATSSDIWMATRKLVGSTYGTWQIAQIKGETGRGVTNTTRYYQLSASVPTRPTDGSTIPSGWSTTEPTYTSGDTRNLYVVDQYTWNSGTTPTYSAVSLSSSYAAAKDAWEAAQGAITSANGKNTIYHQASQPTGSTYKTGDTWFDTDDGYKMYTYNGTSWVAEQFGTNAISDLAITNAKIANATIESAKIASLDAGKITSGYIDANRINAGSITIGKLGTDVTEEIDSKANSSDLSEVATSGDYDDLTGSPTKLSEFTNDSGFTDDTAAAAAQTTANSAQSTANTANSNASTALSTANTANSNASTALSTANTANSTANTANTNATNAAKTATNFIEASGTTGVKVRNSNATGNYALITSSGLTVAQNSSVKATLSDDLQVTESSSYYATLNSSGVNAVDGYGQVGIGVPTSSATYIFMYAMRNSSDYAHLLLDANMNFSIEGPSVKGLLPKTDNKMTLGGTSNRWTKVYAASSSISTSDRRIKKNISDLDSKYIDFFDALEPVSFNRIDLDDDSKIYLGFVAQDVEQALEDAGLDKENHYIVEDGSDAPEGVTGAFYGLAYSEFIAVLVKKIKQLEQRLEELEG